MVGAGAGAVLASGDLQPGGSAEADGGGLSHAGWKGERDQERVLISLTSKHGRHRFWLPVLRDLTRAGPASIPYPRHDRTKLRASKYVIVGQRWRALQ